MYSLFLDSTKVIFEQSLSVSLVRRPSTELFALVLRSSPSNKESRQASSIFMIRRPCFAIFCVFLKEWNRTFLFSKWEICQIIGSLVHWIPFFFPWAQIQILKSSHSLSSFKSHFLHRRLCLKVNWYSKELWHGIILYKWQSTIFRKCSS